MDDFNINKCKAFIDFMLTQQQWSGISKQEIDKWLLNFKDLSPEELKFVYKLLTNIIYFSEKDITTALRTGVFICLSYNNVLEAQKASGFNLSPKALKNIHEENLRKSCFVPLLDKNTPHESGNYVSRTLVQQGIISAEQSMFINEVSEVFKTGKVNRLVIVDDCVGSGDQLTTFWKNTLINDGTEQMSIKEMCVKYGIQANYLTLFGYSKSITALQKKFADLSIFCVRALKDQHRVFSDESYIWKDNNERDRAFLLFDSLTKNAGIPIYGYKNLDFAFVMHRTIPDWSLPLFWKENNDWNLLVRRKNSND